LLLFGEDGTFKKKLDDPIGLEFTIGSIGILKNEGGDYKTNNVEIINVSKDSFISTENITVTGEASQGTTDISDQITWTCSGDNIDSGTCNSSSGTGTIFSFSPNPPADTDGRTGPLSYSVMASVTVDGTDYEDTITITQDNLDELRQEYEDIPGLY